MEKALRTMTLEFCGTGQHKIGLEKFFNSDDMVFLDVRAKEETQALGFNLDIFGIPSVNIPIDELPDRLHELPRNKTIACFCSSGTRSAWAYIYLFSKGFSTKWLEASNEELAQWLKPGRVFKAVK